MSKVRKSKNSNCHLVTKSCPTLCSPRDGGPPGSSVHGMSPVRILEWVVICFSRGSPRPRHWTCVSFTGRTILNYWVTREGPPPRQNGNTHVSFWKLILMQKKSPKKFLRAVKRGWSCQLLVLCSSLKVADTFKYICTYTHILFS